MAKNKGVEIPVSLDIEISDAQKKVDNLKSSIKDLSKAGVPSKGGPFDKLNQDLQKVGRNVGIAKAAYEKLAASKLDTSAIKELNSEFSANQTRIKNANATLDKYEAKLRNNIKLTESQRNAQKSALVELTEAEKANRQILKTLSRQERLDAKLPIAASKYSEALSAQLNALQIKNDLMQATAAAGVSDEKIVEALHNENVAREKAKEQLKEELRQKEAKKQLERELKAEIEDEARLEQERAEAEKMATVRASAEYKERYNTFLILNGIKEDVEFLNAHKAEIVDLNPMLMLDEKLKNLQTQFERTNFTDIFGEPSSLNAINEAVDYIKNAYSEAFEEVASEENRVQQAHREARDELFKQVAVISNVSSELESLQEAYDNLDDSSTFDKFLEQAFKIRNAIQGVSEYLENLDDETRALLPQNFLSGLESAVDAYQRMAGYIEPAVKAIQEEKKANAETKRILEEQAVEEANLEAIRKENLATEQLLRQAIAESNAEQKEASLNVPKFDFEVPEKTSMELQLEGADKIEVQIAKAQEEVIGLVEQMNQFAHVEVPTATFQKFTTEIQATEKQVTKLESELTKMELAGDTGEKYEEKRQKLAELVKVADKLKLVQEELVRTNSAYTIGDQAGIDKAAGKINTLQQKIEVLKATLARKQSNATAKEVEQSIPLYKRFAEALRSVGKESKSTGDKLTQFKKKLKKGLVFITKYFLGFRSLFFLVRKLRRSVGEGITNLYKYDQANNQTTKALDSLATSIQYLKNAWGAAFAPIINAVMPILTALIDMLADAGNAFARFIAQITGQKTVIQAVKVEKKFNDEMDKTASGAGNAAKETEKLNDRLADFDDLHVLGEDKPTNTTGSGGGGGSTKADDDVSKMFTTIETPMTGAMDKIKDFFKPLLDSWNQSGSTVVNGWNSFTTGMSATISAIGSSFATIWTNGSATEVFSNILEIIGNVLDGVGNLGQGFADAWNEAGTGTSIVQGVVDIINILLGSVNNVTASFARWSKNINFSPLLTSINKVVQALKPLTTNIGSGLEWLYNNVLQPLAGWTIEDLLPSFLNVLSGALSVLNALINAFKPAFEWLWDNFLQPIAEWTGGLIVDIINGIADGLNEMAREIEEGEGPMVTILDILGSLAAGFGAVKLGILAYNAVLIAYSTITGTASTVTSGFAAVMAFLTSPFVAIALLIGGLIFLVKQIIKYWDDFAWAWETDLFGIQNAFNGFIDLLSDGLGWIIDSFRDLWDWVSTGWSNFWSGVGDGIVSFYNGFINKIKSIGHFFKEMWEGFKDSAKNIGDWLKNFVLVDIPNFFIDGINGIIGGFEGFVNLCIDGLNLIIGALNSLSIDIPDWVPGVGGETWGINIPKVGHVTYGRIDRVPALAQGAVIPPNREFLALLGDQKNGTNIEAPLDTIVDAFRDVVGNLNVENTGASVMEVDGQVFARLMTPYVVSELGRRGYNVSILEA